MSEKATVTFENEDRTKKIVLTAELSDESTMTMTWDFGKDGIGDDECGLYLMLVNEFFKTIEANPAA